MSNNMAASEKLSPLSFSANLYHRSLSLKKKKKTFFYLLKSFSFPEHDTSRKFNLPHTVKFVIIADNVIHILTSSQMIYKVIITN